MLVGCIKLFTNASVYVTSYEGRYGYANPVKTKNEEAVGIINKLLSFSETVG